MNYSESDDTNESNHCVAARSVAPSRVHFHWFKATFLQQHFCNAANVVIVISMRLRVTMLCGPLPRRRRSLVDRRIISV